MSASREIITLEGEALEAVLERVSRRQMAKMEVTKISIHPRGDGKAAIKVNEGMWTATLPNV